MSITVDGKGWSEAELAEKLREIHEHFVRMDRSFSTVLPGLPNDYPVESLRRFIASSVALSDSVLALPAPPRRLLVQTLNEMYECLNIVPYIVHAAQTDCTPFPGHSGQLADVMA
jgi:hypothetical protein